VCGSLCLAVRFPWEFGVPSSARPEANYGKRLFCLGANREVHRDVIHEAAMLAFRKHPDRKTALQIPPAFLAVAGLPAMHPCSKRP